MLLPPRLSVLNESFSLDKSLVKLSFWGIGTSSYFLYYVETFLSYNLGGLFEKILSISTPSKYLCAFRSSKHFAPNLLYGSLTSNLEIKSLAVGGIN
mgnify:CR=1 FL=1